KPFFSDSLNVEVSNVKVDTLKQKMYDIKDIAQVETTIDWINYILGLFALIAIGFLVYWLIKKYKKPTKIEELVYKTPIEKATSLLQQLEKKELWQKGEIKSYYSELTDIARNYIEEEIHIPAMESTTSELIIGLRKVANKKKLKLSKETLENLEKVLMQADLVKFAKVIPLEFEIEEDKKRITSSIVTIHKSIPEVVEENDELEVWNEEQKKQSLLKRIVDRKIKRIKTAVLILVFLVVALFVFAITTKGLNYVKDLVFGNSTKELVEQDWIYSEYGNPGVKIETPEVLKRIDATKVLPKNAFAILKEMQMFGYGSLVNPFYVAISTTKFKNETEINFDTVLEGITKSWETIGAQNILFKQEEFNTDKGITGVKAFGTMTVINKNNNTSQKMYYEILLFKQDGGLQQIIVSHQEGNQYGKKILERIINSAELKSAK
ncbi:hypothetical protein, partial [Flavobacterium sp.]|uniref:hypothetical protein n=1 Tax=Flavobacterium sp. TaxID=239 RepID=UPI00375312BF